MIESFHLFKLHFPLFCHFARYLTCLRGLRFAGGWLKIEGSNDHDGETVFLDFQNENLLAYTTKNARSDGQRDEVLAVTPDLIAVVDADTGEPVTTEALRYGLRVAVLAMPCSPLMNSAGTLKVVGPAAFKYEGIEYKPLGNC